MAAKQILSKSQEQLEQAGTFPKDGLKQGELKLREPIDLSVIVPICERYDDLEKLYLEFDSQLKKMGKSCEFLFVVDGQFNKAFDQLMAIKMSHPNIRIIKFRQNFGESVALSTGFEQARGKTILTLSPYFQVEPDEIGKVIVKIEEGYDLVITRRYPRIDSLFNRAQSLVFHWLNKKLTGVAYHDISCGLRAMTKRVVKEIHIYGDLHRFIPLLAYRQGFKVVEVEVRQSSLDANRRVYSPGIYLRRLLDILTVFFLFKFTKKPLRFFGLIGSALFMGGSLITAYLGVYRILGYGGIADRPLLLLGVLLMVLGVQTLSIGFIGEIIIFTHARKMKDYAIEEVLK